MTKQCLECGVMFSRRKGYSIRQWNSHRTCGRKCGALLAKRTRPRVRATLADRFWAKVDTSEGLGPNGDCWHWMGHLQNKGYGQLGLAGRCDGTVLAHRAAIFVTTGEWPKRLVCHACDNPRCVRPTHLFDGDQSDNMRDMVNKGRQRRTASL